MARRPNSGPLVDTPAGDESDWDEVKQYVDGASSRLRDAGGRPHEGAAIAQRRHPERRRTRVHPRHLTFGSPVAISIDEAALKVSPRARPGLRALAGQVGHRVLPRAIRSRGASLIPRRATSNPPTDTSSGHSRAHPSSTGLGVVTLARRAQQLRNPMRSENSSPEEDSFLSAPRRTRPILSPRDGQHRPVRHPC